MKRPKITMKRAVSNLNLFELLFFTQRTLSKKRKARKDAG